MGKILLIDDDLNFRKVIRHQLTRMGWEVDEVADRQSAVERCRADRYALILVDVNVPGMRRELAFLAAIRHLRPQTPAIVVSAFSSCEDVRIAFQCGARDFLEKPCDQAALREAVSRWTVRPEPVLRVQESET